MTRLDMIAITTSALLVGQVASFVPAASSVPRSSSVAIFSTPGDGDGDGDADGENVVVEIKEEPVYFNILSEGGGPLSSGAQANAGDYLPSTSTATAINGWVPKEDFALWGLPGAIAPLGFFDPIGFALEGTTLNDAKRLRESEIQHGRVAMLATVGYGIQENILGGGPFHITGPANDQLQQIPVPAFCLLTAFIAGIELYRAKVGWIEPKFRIGSKTLWTLRDTYYPGDIGFDPLGLKPTENYEFQKMQTKELSNGRLAMLGWVGMCSQELINHRTIGETLDFYITVYSGGDPYGY